MGYYEGKARLLVASFAFLLVLVLLVSVSTWVVAQVAPSFKVTVKADGQTRSIRVPEGTVRDALRFAGVFLAPRDETSPPLNTALRDGTSIEIIRVTEKMLRISEPMPFKTAYKTSSTFRGGGSKEIQAGKPGRVDRIYLVTYRNGVESSRKLTATKVGVKPVDRILMIRAAGDLPSRGYYTGRKVLLMHATGYDPGPRSCGKGATGRTAIGLRAGYGVVAVDPKYIPLGTRLYIEGYGYAVAADTGGAIKGNRIDLGHDSYRAACLVGRRTVKVHILD